LPTILIIDDDKLVREATKALLRNKGYDVKTAVDGKSGIDAVRAGAFDLVIVDLFMPDIDGLEVIKTVKRSDPNIPMIAASGFMLGDHCPNMPGFENMALEAGAVSTLYKPFKPKDILQAIESAIGPIA
jgi:CheY-like chemotaxis protein